MQEPGDTCEDPPSTTVIKCVFWGGPVTSDTATNEGQWREDFHVVIAGSNGYVKYGMPDVTGYSSVTLKDAAINAPLDCAGYDTYMGVKIFTNSGPFDPSLCAAACTETSEYNLAHPPASGVVQTCQAFNTYFLLKNGVVEGQYCAMVRKIPSRPKQILLEI